MPWKSSDGETSRQTLVENTIGRIYDYCVPMATSQVYEVGKYVHVVIHASIRAEEKKDCSRRPVHDRK
jgi:hypothetical protein